MPDGAPCWVMARNGLLFVRRSSRYGEDGWLTAELYGRDSDRDEATADCRWFCRRSSRRQRDADDREEPASGRRASDCTLAAIAQSQRTAFFVIDALRPPIVLLTCSFVSESTSMLILPIPCRKTVSIKNGDERAAHVARDLPLLTSRRHQGTDALHRLVRLEYGRRIYVTMACSGAYNGRGRGLSRHELVHPMAQEPT